MTTTAGWKIPKINGDLVRWENHLFRLGPFSIAMLNNQRVDDQYTGNGIYQLKAVGIV
jgi:hypothetical protein